MKGLKKIKLYSYKSLNSHISFPEDRTSFCNVVIQNYEGGERCGFKSSVWVSFSEFVNVMGVAWGDARSKYGDLEVTYYPCFGLDQEHVNRMVKILVFSDGLYRGAMWLTLFQFQMICDAVIDAIDSGKLPESNNEDFKFNQKSLEWAKTKRAEWHEKNPVVV